MNSGTTCLRDGFPMELDLTTVREALDSGWDPPMIYRCRLGHQVRLDTPKELRQGRVVNVCAVCGIPMPSRNGARYCGKDCTRFADRERKACQARGEKWDLERQPWYRGIWKDREALNSLDPWGGSLGKEWLDGWMRLYGEEIPAAISRMAQEFLDSEPQP